MRQSPIQLRLRMHDDLLVDNFAGGGGASTAIEMAFGRPVDIAINHDPEAIAMHEANHPHTRHYCQDVFSIDPLEATGGKRVALAWFSPDCKHFSKAKGGKPRSNKIRDLAWVVHRWAGMPEALRPRLIMLENVEEFRDWGPLLADGRPCPLRKGATFEKWRGQLERLGYEVDCRLLRACDYGAPTIRRRLFLVARCDGQPIVWPEPTHGDPKSEAVRSGKLLPWRTAAECIDWSIPCPSIFDRKRPLAEATMRRIARGIKRYVIDAAEPFIIPIDHTGHGATPVHDIKSPLRTITVENRHALVVPTMIQTGYGEREGQPPRVPGLEKPLGTVVAGGNKHALVAAFLAKHFGGGYTGPGVALDQPAATVTTVDHHALVTANIMRQFGKSVGSSAEEPVGTVTAGGGGKSSLLTSHLIKLRGTCRDGQPTDAPMPTVTSGGNHVGEVRAFLLKYYGSDQDPRLEEPLHTVTTKDRFGLVTVAGEEYMIADIGMRMLEPRELFRAQGFPDTYTIAPEVKGKPLSKAARVRMCGNSVSPAPAAAIIRANIGEMASEVAA